MDAREEIADLEAQIERLSDACARCERVIVIAKVAIAAGMLLLGVVASGVSRLGPTSFVLATAAVLGGIALMGSTNSTREEIRSLITRREELRAEKISGLNLHEVGTER